MKILGAEIRDTRPLYYGLMSIRGLGPYLTSKLINDLSLNSVLKVSDLSTEQQAAIWSYVKEQGIKVEQELTMYVKNNILRQIKLGTYKGSRHVKRLPVRGQRTSTNAKSCKMTKHYSS